jgi:hypothetical protein
MLPTPEQIEAYRRDGFLVVAEWLGDAFFPVLWA